MKFIFAAFFIFSLAACSKEEPVSPSSPAPAASATKDPEQRYSDYQKKMKAEADKYKN